jgi:hypothetical protein
MANMESMEDPMLKLIMMMRTKLRSLLVCQSREVLPRNSEDTTQEKKMMMRTSKDTHNVVIMVIMASIIRSIMDMEVAGSSSSS